MPHEYQVGLKGIIVQKKQALIVRGILQSGESRWDLPGGRMEKGETIEETLRREVTEELPSLKSLKIQDLLYATATKHRESGKELVTLFYLISGHLSVIKLSKEHVEHRWVKRSEIDSLEKDTGYKLFRNFDIALKKALT